MRGHTRQSEAADTRRVAEIICWKSAAPVDDDDRRQVLCSTRPREPPFREWRLARNRAPHGVALRSDASGRPRRGYRWLVAAERHCTSEGSPRNNDEWRAVTSSATSTERQLIAHSHGSGASIHRGAVRRFAPYRRRDVVRVQPRLTCRREARTAAHARSGRSRRFSSNSWRRHRQRPLTPLTRRIHERSDASRRANLRAAEAPEAPRPTPTRYMGDTS